MDGYGGGVMTGGPFRRLKDHPQFGGAMISGIAFVISLVCAIVLLAQ